MGLDVYAGTVTRYYARNWKTVGQQAAERFGYGYQVFRANDVPDAETDVNVIQEDVSAWCTAVSASLTDAVGSVCTAWEENNEKDYFTDKPDWLAYEVLLLFGACLQYDLPFPETVRKGEDIFEHETLKRAMNDPELNWSLFSSVEWWLPYDECFTFRGAVPNGTQIAMSTTALLLAELNAINDKSWQADEQTILSWTENEGYPSDGYIKDGKYIPTGEHTEYDSVSLAKFAFSVLYRAARFSQENRVPIILDY